MDDAAKRLRLRPGDVLIFEERRRPAHRAAGRRRPEPPPGRPPDLRAARPPTPVLTQENDVAVEVDRTPGPLVTDPLNDQPIVEIAWAAEDALPFPLCLSAITDRGHGAQAVDGRQRRAGQRRPGRSRPDDRAAEPLGAVPEPAVFLAPARRGGALRTAAAHGGRAAAVRAHAEASAR